MNCELCGIFRSRIFRSDIGALGLKFLCNSNGNLTNDMKSMMEIVQHQCTKRQG